VGLKKKETKLSGKRKSEVRKKRKKKSKNVGLVLFEEKSVDNGQEGLLEQKILVSLLV
jgi:hypothetical protein